MSRKRTHNEAEAEEEYADNNMYLLPGCYRICCSCPQQETVENVSYVYNEEPLLVEQPTFLDGGIYVADSYGNIFCSGYVSYLYYVDIIHSGDAQLETDDLSDPEEGRERKKTRLGILSDDEEPSYGREEEFPPYIVEEPPDEDDVPKRS